MKSKVNSSARLSVLLLLVAFAFPALAQDISKEHIEAAKKAISSTRATNAFDVILIQAAANTKTEFIDIEPNKADQITQIVDEEAISMAKRRGDLENEAARLFANSFSQEELTAIAEFFGSKTGQKYLNNTPILARELSQVARSWAAGINRDLKQQAGKRISELK